MTQQRTRRSIIYRCDRPGCDRKHVAPFTKFNLAWEHAKSQGWIAANHNDHWFHFCDWVHRPPNPRQFQQMLDHPEKPCSEVLMPHDTSRCHCGPYV